MKRQWTRRVASAICTALLWTAPVEASKLIDPRIPTWEQSHLAQGNPAVHSLYILSVCIRNHKRAEAEAFLAAEPGSAEEGTLLHAMIPSGKTDCPIRPGEMRIRGAAPVRGALSEAIYNFDRRKPRGAGPLGEAEAFSPAQAGSSFLVAGYVARCAVNRSPLLAHAVLTFNYGSPGEMRALRALDSTFIGCLPADSRLEISRIYMRLLLAQALYRASERHKEAFSHG